MIKLLYLLSTAATLTGSPELVFRLEATLVKLYGPKIGSWGRLMEWREETPDLEKSNHRHTSQLFAVPSSVQISQSVTPELAEAARVSLAQHAEMLLQSHAREIDLLPALPNDWPTGAVKGLRARGGFLVDIRWQDGKLTEATIRSTHGPQTRVHYRDTMRDITLKPGGSTTINP